MFYHLLYNFVDAWGPLNVTRYITFRSMIALLTALFISFILSPWFIRRLKIKQLGQIVRDDGPSSHLAKAGTPTMGGGLIILAVVIPGLMWMDWFNYFTWLTLVVFAGYGLLGFWDDYAKIARKSSKGVSGRGKLAFQFSIALAVCTFHVLYGDESGAVGIPFFKDLTLELGYSYIPFGAFVIVGSSNAVNLTDGLDGLAIGPVMITAGCYTVLAYVSGNYLMAEYLQFPFVSRAGELSIFAASLVGAGLGFLWYNTYPAQVFMGDVGSLPLGGALGALAVFSKHEILLVIIGGVFVLEAFSVISQVASYKWTGKRIFKMAPIHHHFELKGWAEPKVIVRFWIISIILALVGLLSLKIR